MHKLGLDKLHQCCDGDSSNKQWVGGVLEDGETEEEEREREMEREGIRKLEVRRCRRRREHELREKW